MIFSANVTKSAVDLVTFTEEILNEVLHFLCSASFDKRLNDYNHRETNFKRNL